MSESTTEAPHDEMTRKRWRALLKTFGIYRNASVSDVREVLERMSRSRVMCFQLALKGIGYDTEKFNPDGVLDLETKTTIINTFEAAGIPEG